MPSTAPHVEDRQVLAALATGATDVAIAHRLGCSERTLRRRVHAALAALGARSRFQGGYLYCRSLCGHDPHEGRGHR